MPNTRGKHTAGPLQQHPKRRYLVTDADGTLVADCGNNVPRLPEEQRANARLFAAAPELLEAAKALMSRNVAHVNDIQGRRLDCVGMFREDFYALRDVIAKAQGQEVTA